MPTGHVLQQGKHILKDINFRIHTKLPSLFSCVVIFVGGDFHFFLGVKITTERKLMFLKPDKFPDNASFAKQCKNNCFCLHYLHCFCKLALLKSVGN